LALYEEIGSDSGRALALNGLGTVYHLRGRLDDALEHLGRALQAHRLVGSRDGEVDTLTTMAEVHLAAGRYAEAIEVAEVAEVALTLAREVDLRRAEVGILDTLGSTYERLGDYQQALGHHHNAHTLAHQIGHPMGEANALAGTAAALLGLGDGGPAILTGCRRYGSGNQSRSLD
jgi:tetratricopeptide (TPR) repeat protein